MDGLHDVIGWLQLAEWLLLALAAGNLWRTRRTAPTRWLAFTFATVALVLVAGRLLPAEQVELNLLVRLLLAVFALFPYLLYRFVISMTTPRRWAWITAHVLTAAAIGAAFIVTALPRDGEPRPLGATIFIVVFLVQWGFLLARVAWQLWRAGIDQPAVARKRMRTMAVAAIVLALILVFGALRSPDDTDAIALTLDAIGLLAAPLFLVGFNPPPILRILWRQREEAELRETEIGLVRAIARPDVAREWLPRVSALVGGEGAAIIDSDGSTLATHRFDDDDLARARSVLPPADGRRYVLEEAGPFRILTMHNGWLVVELGALTPFFGEDELRMVGASSVVADLALGRARLFELERQSRDAMRDFVAIASHDLRTPVTVIAGFTDLMQMQGDHLSDDDKQGFLEAISRQVSHLNRLIDDLLTVSKLDVHEIDVFPQPVDVVRTARDVVGELGSDASVIVRGPVGSPHAMADADHVMRMIRNYVANAQIYGAAPVTVQIESDDASVVVRVCDRGPGVPADFVPKLFEKFARLDRKKSKAVQGTGLGLSIVLGLARSNGGDAWYEPNEPVGACFCFRLAAAPVPSEAARA